MLTPEEYEAKRTARYQRLLAAADKAQAEARTNSRQANEMASVIPFGQPILCGHHSETRDRNYRSRIDNKYRKGYELAKRAEELRSRAASIANNAAIYSDDPAAPDKLAAKVAELEAKQARMKATNKAIKLYNQFGIEIIQTTRRICYKSLFKGWAWIQDDPKKKRYGQIVETSSQFPSAWYTYRLNIGTPLTFCDLHIPRKYHATLEYNELHARRATLTPAEQTKYNALEVYIRHLYTCHTQAGK